MFKFLLILTLAIASANAFWTPCTSGPAPTSVTSPSCSGTSCTITRGEILRATFVFPANVAASSLDVIIRAYAAIGGDPIQLPVTPPHDNACSSISPSCPTSVGTSYTWNIDFEVPTDIPAINGFFTFSLTSGTTIVTCANATASLH
ncbi:hypothetical protein PVAND_006332 [Polypedilum vanderplanki]|uniref:MD-2-related lipid-recognition domain-containing protein n=1 Tax=Polypedilum vanderplanki TaxID=319348 RepID=A0A9J6C3M5_POLVA|nr:hypothetical protein PVAND_006332 [Polypedilum vanderplanki]